MADRDSRSRSGRYSRSPLVKAVAGGCLRRNDSSHTESLSTFQLASRTSSETPTVVHLMSRSAHRPARGHSSPCSSPDPARGACSPPVGCRQPQDRRSRGTVATLSPRRGTIPIRKLGMLGTNRSLHVHAHLAFGTLRTRLEDRYAHVLEPEEVFPSRSACRSRIRMNRPRTPVRSPPVRAA